MNNTNRKPQKHSCFESVTVILYGVQVM